jgi:hypothetical protein
MGKILFMIISSQMNGVFQETHGFAFVDEEGNDNVIV